MRTVRPTSTAGDQKAGAVPAFADSAISGGHCAHRPYCHQMLETVAVVLLVLWVLGMVSSNTIGGLIHVLLVVAVVVVLVRIIRGKRIA